MAYRNTETRRGQEFHDGGGSSSSSISNNKTSSMPRGPLLTTDGPFTAFVGNLPDTVMQSDLEVIFRGIPLRSIRLVRDRDTDRFKGFCYVEFDTFAQLQDALELDGAQVDGRIIRVNIAPGRQDRRNVGRRDGGRDSGRDQGDHQQRRNQSNYGNSNNNSSSNNNNSSDRDNQRRQDKPSLGGVNGGRDFQGAAWNMRRRSQHQVQQSQQYQQSNHSNRSVDQSTRSNQTADLGSSGRSRHSDNQPAQASSSKDDSDRPRLKLAPRTVSTPVAALADALARSSIFGEGKPRDDRAFVDAQKKPTRKQTT